MKVAIGIPAFNEEKNIASVIIKLKKFADTIIVCNDGSSDLTSSIAKGLGAIVIDHSKNLGYGAAIRTIFLKTRDLDVDALVTFDADGQHDVNDIPKILEPIKKKEADIVIGSRFLSKTSAVPRYRKMGIKTITELTNVSTHSKITDAQSGFRAYSKTVFQNILPSEDGMGVSTEILIKAAKQQFKITEIPIIIAYEGNTSTHNPVSHGASVVLSTLKFISIEHPLKFYGIPGVIFLGLGLFFIGWTVNEYSQFDSFPLHVALIGIGSIILGTMFEITAVLLYSLTSIVRERR